MHIGVAAIVLACAAGASVLTGCQTKGDHWSDNVETVCRNGDRLYAVVGNGEVDEGFAVVADDPTCRSGR